MELVELLFHISSAMTCDEETKGDDAEEVVFGRMSVAERRGSATLQDVVVNDGGSGDLSVTLGASGQTSVVEFVDAIQETRPNSRRQSLEVLGAEFSSLGDVLANSLRSLPFCLYQVDCERQGFGGVELKAMVGEGVLQRVPKLQSRVAAAGCLTEPTGLMGANQRLERAG